MLIVVLTTLVGAPGALAAGPAASDAGSPSIPGPRVEPSIDLTPPCGPDQAWIGLFGDGLVCLDGAGWTTFDEANSPLVNGQIADIAVCPDGTTWVADSSGLVSTDGTVWTSHRDTIGDTFSVDTIECDPQGGVWLGGYETLAHYDGTHLTQYPIESLGTAEFVSQVKDLAFAPDGNLWVTTADSVATFDGEQWTYWQEGHGLKDETFFKDVIVDGKGVVWAEATSGFLRFDGNEWTSYQPDFMWQPQPMTLDRDGHLWVGTYADGLAMLKGDQWVRYTRDNSPLPSDKIKSLAIDAAGRVWVGTEWGLAIINGQDWQVYHMSDAELPDNEIRSLAVIGAGPALPVAEPKAPGTLTGRIVRGGAPQSGLQVEACAELIGMLLVSKTPCEDQAFHKATKTDTEGRFTFADLPVGKYGLALQDKEGKWLRLTDRYNIGNIQTTVPPGGTTDMGDIELD